MNAVCHPNRPSKARGICHPCYQRGRYHQARPNAFERRTQERLEDLLWMHETGESAAGAARRLGLTEKALEKWCRRRDLGDLYVRMVARNPRPVEHLVAA